jgi:hypothetical protein
MIRSALILLLTIVSPLAMALDIASVDCRNQVSPWFDAAKDGVQSELAADQLRVTARLSSGLQISKLTEGTYKKVEFSVPVETCKVNTKDKSLFYCVAGPTEFSFSEGLYNAKPVRVSADLSFSSSLTTHTWGVLPTTNTYEVMISVLRPLQVFDALSFELDESPDCQFK